MPKPIDSPEYWIESFSPAEREIERLYEHVLEVGRPLEIDTLAEELVRFHVGNVMEARRANRKSDGKIYEPSQKYESGQKLVFPALEGAEGVVEAVRPGNNPEYGNYEVIEVKLGSERREFAAGLQWEHPLSQAVAEVDPDEVAERFAPLVAPQLAGELSTDDDWVSYGDRWILQALLPEVHAGHRNLAEAILLLGGEPLPAAQILPELDLDESVPEETRAMALEIALAEDERFRNVGALESPIWALVAQG